MESIQQLKAENKWLKQSLYDVYAQYCNDHGIEPDDIHQWWRNVKESVVYEA